MMERYRVDLDELLTFADRLKSFDDRADQIASAVDGLVAALHGSWLGESADAHQQRHDDWMTEAEDMRRAVKQLQDAATRAHRNYSDVIELNTAMWP